MDCSPPDSSVREIPQTRTLEWVAISHLTQGLFPQGLRVGDGRSWSSSGFSGGKQPLSGYTRYTCHLGLIFSQTQDANSLRGSCCSWPRWLPAVVFHRQQWGWLMATAVSWLRLCSSLPVLLTGVAPSLGSSAQPPVSRSLTPHEVTTSSDPSLPTSPPWGTPGTFLDPRTSCLPKADLRGHQVTSA